ncbi:hypothetical protein KCP78_11130 [Salmonella enterica subsp. enterica]|nr:hypothetical protein KCP78_11130 [Salmonella enterica subsp. enterica]
MCLRAGWSSPIADPAGDGFLSRRWVQRYMRRTFGTDDIAFGHFGTLGYVLLPADWQSVCSKGLCFHGR